MKKLKEKIKKINWTSVAITVALIVFWTVIIMFLSAIKSRADGPGYEYIEQTESQLVIELTEQMADIYPICPELLQAVVFYESSNRMDARNGSCVGYMQVSEKYHSSRANQLGVSIYDGYGNILTGTDYLYGLAEKYNDMATALMVYHGEKNAAEKGENGEISSYAMKILDLSAKLERLHGK